VGWWLDHRYVSRQLKYCYDQLLVTEQEFTESQKQVEDGQRAASAAASEIQRLKRQSAINAERPLPTPRPFVKQMSFLSFPLMLLIGLLIVGRSELGVKGIATCVILFAALIALLMAFGLPPVLIATAAAVFDIVLIFVIFGADLPLRPKK